MTTADKRQTNSNSVMSSDAKDDTRKDIADAISKLDIEASLKDKLLGRIFRKPKTVTIRTWITTNGNQTVIEEKTVKLGVKDVPIGKHEYAINYDYIQNINGKLIYNTKYGIANGALSYTKIPKEVDAQFRKQLRARDNLHAIWSRWQLPFIATIIAMVVAIIAIAVLAGIVTQWQSAMSCMNNPQCLATRLSELGAVTTNG